MKTIYCMICDRCGPQRILCPYGETPNEIRPIRTAYKVGLCDRDEIF
jgi:hypothetical protein